MNKKQKQDATKPAIDNHLPSWLQHFNFLSLLNLPETMDLYGPLVNTWEGGNRGEGFLRHIKPIITNTVCANWNVIAHEHVMKNKSKCQVLHQHFKSYSPEKQAEFVSIFSCYDEDINFFTYKEIDIFLHHLGMNKPLSCVLLKSGTISAILSTRDDVMIGVEVETKYSEEIKTLAMSFHTLIVQNNDHTACMTQFPKTAISNYLLLLPKMSLDGFASEPNQNLYYIIADDWTELNKDDIFVTPTICN